MNATTAEITVIREPGLAEQTPRVRAVCTTFGILPRESPRVIAAGLALRLAPGHIILIAGPSGAGKSSVLDALAGRAPRCVRVDLRRRRGRCAVIDGVARHRPVGEAMGLLTACGLGEPRLWLRGEGELSAGEQFRAALARAVGLARRVARADGAQGTGAAPVGAAGPVIVCDEFASGLHRRLARAMAYNLRKLASRTGLCVVVATAADDLASDLRPDAVVRLGAGEARLEDGRAHGRGPSVGLRAVIEEGGVGDYAAFAAMHYRQRDGLGFVERVFVLRERPGGDILGIAVYAMPPIELAARNRATDGRFVANPARLNREMRILRRLVIHPDVRGCGLGRRLVRRTLRRVGTRFVECLAAMGAVNPVFERAGMRRVGPVRPGRGRASLAARLRAAGIDALADDFERRVRRCPRVRRLVEQAVFDWLRGTSGTGRGRLSRYGAEELARRFRQLAGAEPEYYLWDREGEFPRGDSLARGGYERRPGRGRRPEKMNDRFSPGVAGAERERHRPEVAGGRRDEHR